MTSLLLEGRRRSPLASPFQNVKVLAWGSSPRPSRATREKCSRPPGTPLHTGEIEAAARCAALGHFRLRHLGGCYSRWTSNGPEFPEPAAPTVAPSVAGGLLVVSVTPSVVPDLGRGAPYVSAARPRHLLSEGFNWGMHPYNQGYEV
ncbi:hypothetical protein NDU88_002786 [Pleurodeles waltl]|uniref:Uncharacterized protein n=1 Tax=Pleurodeles waltl TaxID=8319 RepID=A0AAV7SFV6_PLEWA|nr:hypothetical protein NDU88_002786 [Pleurodeles waltl]